MSFEENPSVISPIKGGGAMMNPDSVLSESDLQDLKVSFDFFDKDGSGTISHQELLAIMQDFGYSKEDARAAAKAFDQDGSGEVDFEEFVEVMRKKMEEASSPEEMILAALKAFDDNGDGNISPVELRTAIRNLGGTETTEEEIDEIIRHVEIDVHGNVNSEDFVKNFLAL